MIQGKIFYQYGEYSISIGGLTAEQTEQITKKLKGTVLLRRNGYTG